MRNRFLEWEATYGYGDIIGGVTHAIRHDRDLYFNWHKDRHFYPPNQKYHPDDPETIMERTEYIISKFKCDIEIEHRHKDKMEYRFVNRIEETEWYGTVAPTVDEPEVTDTIAIWHPMNNVDRKRCPLSNENWHALLKILNRKGENLEILSYRDPIDHVFETIRKSKLCIGYEGMGQLISKNYYKPLITYSDNKALSKVTGGEWSYVSNVIDYSVLEIDKTIELQKEKIDKVRNDTKSLHNWSAKK